MRKLWEDITYLGKNCTGYALSTNPICYEPIEMENQPPNFGQNQLHGRDWIEQKIDTFKKCG